MHEWKYCEGEFPRGQLHWLIRLIKGWLGPANTIKEVFETMVVDKCLRELPTHLVKTVSHGNPTTVLGWSS